MLEALFSEDMRLVGAKQDDDFVIVSTPIYTPVGGSSVPATDKDTNVNRITGAVTTIGASISVAPLQDKEVLIENLTPDIASLSDTIMTPIQTGTGVVDVSVWPYGTRRARVPISTGNPFTYDEPVSFQPGSCAKHIYDVVSGLINGHIASAPIMELYSAANYNTGAPSGTRNPAFYGSLLDLSGISFSRTLNGAQQDWFFPGTLLRDSEESNRFIACASHVRFNAGDTVVFQRSNGTMQATSILDVENFGHDMSVAYMGAAITGCNAMRILPDDWLLYLPVGVLDGGKLPTLCRNAKTPNSGSANRLCVTYLRAFSTGELRSYGNPADEPPPEGHGGPGEPFTGLMAPFSDWRLPILSGSSGSPNMWPISGQPVYAGQQWQYQVVGSYLNNTAPIEAWMSGKLGHAVTLSRANLTGFNAYP